MKKLTKPLLGEGGELTREKADCQSLEYYIEEKVKKINKHTQKRGPPSILGAKTFGFLIILWGMEII